MKRALPALFILTLTVAAVARPITEKDLFRFQWASDPQVSPDGTQAAFVRINVDEKKEGYQTSLWLVPVRGGGAPRRLTNGPRDGSPRWSPDGRMLAFVRSTEKDGKPQPGQIFLLSLGGGEPRALTSMPKPVEAFAWAPGGKSIAFTATTKPQDFEKKDKDKDKNEKADKSDKNDKNDKNDKDRKDGDEHESDVRVINQAVYRFNGGGYLDASRTTHIWTIEVPESLGDEAPKPKQITSGDFSEGDLAWSPDGRQMYLADTASQRIMLYDYDLDSGAMSNERLFADAKSHPGKPDGSCVDADGCLWNAEYGGWRLVRSRPRDVV